MAEVAALVTHISTDEAQARIADGAVVIDVRFPFDYAGGRIPGALNMPGASFLNRHHIAPKNRPFIFVCADGQDSPEVAVSAMNMGFADVAVLEGGFDSWYDKDLPTETMSDGVSSTPAVSPPPAAGKPS